MILMNSVEIFLAKRYLSSHRGKGLSLITWIALAGVIVGVMSLITVLSVMSGFERELSSIILGNNAHITLQLDSSVTSEKELDDVLRRIQETPGVASAMPVIYGEGFILGDGGRSDGVMLKGVDPKRVDQVLDLKNFIEERSGTDPFEKPRGVILGSRLAEGLGLFVDDRFTLVLNQGEFTPLGVMPKMRRLDVAGTFRSGMTQYDARHGYLSLKLAEEIFGEKPRWVEVKTTDVRKISKVRNHLRQEIPEALQVVDWISQNRDILSALQLEKTAMAVILGLIILVASFNICGSLIMVVRDKMRDIAILKSMGSLDRTILKIFLLQGVFIGAVGTTVGLALGWLASILLRDHIRFPLNKEVYMIDTLPVDLRWSDFVLVSAGALLISIIATLYPAILASRVVPTEGLKAE